MRQEPLFTDFSTLFPFIVILLILLSTVLYFDGVPDIVNVVISICALIGIIEISKFSMKNLGTIVKLSSLLPRKKIRLTSEIPALSWSPDGHFIACGTVARGVVTIVDSESHTITRTFSKHPYASTINHVVWSPDGRLIASGGSDSIVHVWDAHTEETVVQVKSIGAVGAYSVITALAWSPDGKFIAICSSSYGVAVYAIPSGEELWHITQVQSIDKASLTWSPDSKQLAILYGASVVSVFSMSEKVLVYSYDGYRGNLVKISWSPNGKYLIIAGYAASGSFHLIDAVTGIGITKFGENFAIDSLSWSPNGEYITAVGGLNTFFCIWEAKTGKEIQRTRFFKGSLWSVSWSPTGKYIATGGSAQIVTIWSIKKNSQFV